MRKEVVADLRSIYAAATIEETELQIDVFEENWTEAYPPISQSWRRTGIGLSRSLTTNRRFARSFTPPTQLNL